MAFNKVDAVKSFARTVVLILGGRAAVAKWDAQVAALDAMTDEQRDAWTDEQVRLLHEARQARKDHA